MDSLPKKRKLVEFGTNISPPKGQSFTKSSYILGENKYKALSKLRKKIKHDIVSEDEDSINVQVKKSPQELIKSEQTIEDDIKCPEIRNSQKKLIFEDSRHGEFIWDNDRKEVVWFSTDYIEDIITHEMFKESLYRLSGNFCKVYDINPTGREILIDWLISVQIHLKAENSTLHLAVALLDIVLDKVHIPLNELQAAAAAAFWVSYKFIHGSIGVLASKVNDHRVTAKYKRYIEPLYNNAYGSKELRTLTPKIFNQIPNHLMNFENIGLGKRHINTWLLDNIKNYCNY